MQIKSHTLVSSDFKTEWYKKWAKELKQDKNHLDNHDLLANKFWQNAIIIQALAERLDFSNGVSGVGFGVGRERVPAVLAKLGAQVTATDQDFSTDKAKHWQEHELAQGAQSLNALKICDPKIFKQNVAYMAVDMTKVPKKLHGKYDFAWSNCALGHLGSIDAGLKFIEASLECLKPGGWAVHTTELNVLSNTTTSEGGDTVIFRAKDVHNFYRDLTKKGYVCEPLLLTFGTDAHDARVSIRPKFGNDFSKIQVNGHLATQAILIIHKPVTWGTPVSRLTQAKRLNKLGVAYAKNLKTLAMYKRTNHTIKQILDSQRAPLAAIQIKPKTPVIKLKIKKGQEKELVIEFNNSSQVPLFSLYSRLGNSNPVVLATSGPNDRQSAFASKDWLGQDKNRVSSDLQIVSGKTAEPADYVKPGQQFGFLVKLDTSGVKKGAYSEEFSVVQESKGWVENSSVRLEITVY